MNKKNIYISHIVWLPNACHFLPTLYIDLRWNNVGLLGARAILEMLQTNKTLCRLELAGNNIPSDILKAIGIVMLKDEFCHQQEKIWM